MIFYYSGSQTVVHGLTCRKCRPIGFGFTVILYNILHDLLFGLSQKDEASKGKQLKYSHLMTAQQNRISNK